MLFRRSAVTNTLVLACTLVLAACSEDAYYGDPGPATGRGRSVALVWFLILFVPAATGGAGLTWLHRSGRGERVRPPGSIRAAGVWYLVLAALVGLPGAYILVWFATKASTGFPSVGQERRFVDYEALISGLIGLCSLVTAILVATVGLGLVSHGGGYRWAAAACSGLLLALGVTIAVAGVGQRTPSPFIAAALLVMAGAGPVPMLFWRGPGDHEP